jgi:hypothetical protein
MHRELRRAGLTIKEKLAHRSWIFPRDPDFETKAGRVLDLCARTWAGNPLGSTHFVISTDETTSIRRSRDSPDAIQGASLAHSKQRVSVAPGTQGMITTLPCPSGAMASSR